MIFLFQDQEIQEGGRYSMNTSNGIASLTISDVTGEDCDKYSLVVRNTHSAHSAFASLAVEGNLKIICIQYGGIRT